MVVAAHKIWKRRMLFKVIILQISSFSQIEYATYPKVKRLHKVMKLPDFYNLYKKRGIGALYELWAPSNTPHSSLLIPNYIQYPFHRMFGREDIL